MPTLAFKAPRSFELPAGTRRTGEAHHHRAVQIPRVPHDPAALWHPRRWALALPAVCDEADFTAWLAWARPGWRASYWCGMLPVDRRADPELDLLARAILFRSTATINATSICGHARACWVASGDVALSQIRVGDLVLADFSQYAIGLRKELILQKSIHAGWQTDESGYRVIVRVDGQGKWSQAIKPKNGPTLSWAIALAARP